MPAKNLKIHEKTPKVLAFLELIAENPLEHGVFNYNDALNLALRAHDFNRVQFRTGCTVNADFTKRKQRAREDIRNFRFNFMDKVISRLEELSKDPAKEKVFFYKEAVNKALEEVDFSNESSELNKLLQNENMKSLVSRRSKVVAKFKDYNKRLVSEYIDGIWRLTSEPIANKISGYKVAAMRIKEELGLNNDQLRSIFQNTKVLRDKRKNLEKKVDQTIHNAMVAALEEVHSNAENYRVESAQGARAVVAEMFGMAHVGGFSFLINKTFKKKAEKDKFYLGLISRLEEVKKLKSAAQLTSERDSRLGKIWWAGLPEKVQNDIKNDLVIARNNFKIRKLELDKAKGNSSEYKSELEKLRVIKKRGEKRGWKKGWDHYRSIKK